MGARVAQQKLPGRNPHITGRDIEQCEVHLELMDHRWSLVKNVRAEDLAVASVPACIHEAVGFINTDGDWEGRTRELMNEARIGDISAVIAVTFGVFGSATPLLLRAKNEPAVSLGANQASCL